MISSLSVVLALTYPSDAVLQSIYHLREDSPRRFGEN